MCKRTCAPRFFVSTRIIVVRIMYTSLAATERETRIRLDILNSVEYSVH
jgi:hypothetical protein